MPRKITMEQHLSQINMRSANKLEEIAAIYDDIFDHLGLGHPMQNLVSLMKDLSPKEVLGHKLNIPPPGELLDSIFAALREKWHEFDPIRGTGVGAWAEKIREITHGRESHRTG